MDETELQRRLIREQADFRRATDFFETRPGWASLQVELYAALKASDSPSPERSLEDIALEGFDIQAGKCVTLVSNMETHRHFAALLPMFARRALLIVGDLPLATVFSDEGWLFRNRLDQKIHDWLDASFQRVAEAERTSGELKQESNQRHESGQQASKRASKPGPKRDLETAYKVRDIVNETANGEKWKGKGKLPDILDALDEAAIKCPKRWSKRNPPLYSWADATGSGERELAKKAIEHHLENAKI